MSPIRIGVIGAGHLGRIHSRLAATLSNATLAVVAEPSPLAQKQLLEQVDVQVVSDYTQILDEIDAAIIATPTRFHFEIAEACLRSGKHVLIEKPLTDSVDDARRLVDIATETGCVVQVGHCERFNEAIRQAVQTVGTPRFVQAERLSGFTYRSTDIGVVHDLMIHDIDLVNSMFSGSIAELSAHGVGVFGENEDIAQARLSFDCGGVANLTASRCSFEPRRQMQIFGTTGFASVDLANHTVKAIQIPSWMQGRQFDFLHTTPEQQAFVREKLFQEILKVDELQIEPVNAILCEQEDWLNAISNQSTPRISVQAGAEAVEIADRILNQISTHSWLPGQPGAQPVVPTHEDHEIPAELQVKETAAA